MALALSPSSAQAADWQESFADGVKARDLGQWEEVVRFMRQAINQNPRVTGKLVRVYGMKWERYLPHYYLGVALYRLNDCHGALSAFERSRAAGKAWAAARGNMKDMERDCRRKLGPTVTASSSRTSSPTPSSGPSSPPAGSKPTTSTHGRRARTTSGRQVQRVTTAQPGGKGSTANRSPSPSQRPPHPPPPTNPMTVRKQVLAKKAEEAQEVLRQAGELASALDRHLENTRQAAFRRNPALKERYQAAYHKLNSARTLLRAAEREGDLQAVERAGQNARKIVAELEELGRAVGTRR